MIAKVGIAILALATVVLFTIAAVHNNDLFWGDRTILSSLRIDDTAWQRFFAWFDIRGVAGVSSVLAISIVFSVFRKRLEALIYLAMLPVMGFTIVLPKAFVNRPRPEGALEGFTDSFPSGTATTSVLLLGFLIYLIGEFVAPRKLRIGLQLALGMAIVLLGLFRMLAGEHWPSDLVGGYMTGALALIAIIWAYRKLRRR
ncbi:MAG TPA: phosphatase PAP2 family protein [Dehalococcoidia bacterium]|nr:phosphatase PAP2 family protein [Dehalococcoidia bacterium]